MSPLTMCRQSVFCKIPTLVLSWQVSCFIKVSGFMNSCLIRYRCVCYFYGVGFGPEQLHFHPKQTLENRNLLSLLETEQDCNKTPDP